MHRRATFALPIVLAVLLGACGCGAPDPAGDARVVSAAPQAPEPAAVRQAAPPHEYVAPAAPTWFEMSGPEFTIPADVCQMDNVRPLDPPGDQRHTVCWVREGFGVAPGSASGGTSYILGHAWARTPLVLNPLSETATRELTFQHPVMQSGVATYPVRALNGYEIVLRTPGGTLTYTVSRAFAVAKPEAADVESLMANTPDRVVIITCAVKDGADLDYNIIVDAYLTSSTAGQSLSMR